MLICNVCSRIYPYDKVKCYIDHYRSHTNTPNITFPYGFSICHRKFRTHNAFRSHMNRNHNFRISPNAYITQKLTCTVGTCLKEFNSIKELKTKHLKSL